MKLPVEELSPVVTSCETLPSDGVGVDVVTGEDDVGDDAEVVCPTVVFTTTEICIL